MFEIEDAQKINFMRMYVGCVYRVGGGNCYDKWGISLWKCDTPPLKSFQADWVAEGCLLQENIAVWESLFYCELPK